MSAGQWFDVQVREAGEVLLSPTFRSEPWALRQARRLSREMPGAVVAVLRYGYGPGESTPVAVAVYQAGQEAIQAQEAGDKFTLYVDGVPVAYGRDCLGLVSLGEWYLGAEQGGERFEVWSSRPERMAAVVAVPR